jgi:Spy/CpxP family protein refolding chaperone
MSLKNRFLSILTVAFATVAFSTFTFAQDSKATTPAPDKEKAQRHATGEGREMGKHAGHGEGMGERQGGMMRMLQDLNLTEAQKTQIHAILDANKSDQATHDEMRTLFEAKRSGTLTAEQQARLDTLKQQTDAKMKSVHEQILNVLTAEQKAQLEQKRAEMKKRREEFRNRQTPAVNAAPTKEN